MQTQTDRQTTTKCIEMDEGKRKRVTEAVIQAQHGAEQKPTRSNIQTKNQSTITFNVQNLTNFVPDSTYPKPCN